MEIEESLNNKEEFILEISPLPADVKQSSYLAVAGTDYP